MAEVVVIVPGLGPLALAPETLAEARRRGAALMPDMAVPSPATAGSESPALLSAEDMEERTGVPASWWMAQARERRIPFRKIGRYVRFDWAEVMASDAAKARTVIGFGIR